MGAGHLRRVPDGTCVREQWAEDVREVARYRAQYEITDPREALGRRPESDQPQHDWELANEAVEQGELRLGRELAAVGDIDLGLDY